MSTFKIRSASDMVAAAVGIAGYLPSSEVVVFVAGEAASAAMTTLPDQLEMEDIPALAAALARLDGNDPSNAPVAVVFGSPEQAAAVALALIVAFPAVECAMLAFTGGRAVGLMNMERYEGNGAAVDLASHPFIAERILESRMRLMTRQELEDTFRPAQFGPERAASLARDTAARADELRGEQATEAAQRVFRTALAPYLDADADRAVLVSPEHMALLAAAANEKPVRDVLIAEFTTDRVSVLGEVWRQVGSSLPAPISAGATVLAGACHWGAGDIAVARAALDQGLAAEPTHRLGRLLRGGIANGVPSQVWDQVRQAIASKSEAGER